jgi:hypothetical protein
MSFSWTLITLLLTRVGLQLELANWGRVLTAFSFQVLRNRSSVREDREWQRQGGKKFLIDKWIEKYQKSVQATGLWEDWWRGRKLVLQKEIGKAGEVLS